MLVLVWIALALAILATGGGGTFALLRGLRAWRGLKTAGGRIGAGLETVARTAADVEVHLERGAAGSERLAAALDRLARSRARLDVQRAALQQALDAVRRAVPFPWHR